MMAVLSQKHSTASRQKDALYWLVLLCRTILLNVCISRLKYPHIVKWILLPFSMLRTCRLDFCGFLESGLEKCSSCPKQWLEIKHVLYLLSFRCTQNSLTSYLPTFTSYWYTCDFVYLQIIVWWVLWNRISLVHGESSLTRLWILSKTVNVLTQPSLMFK